MSNLFGMGRPRTRVQPNYSGGRSGGRRGCRGGQLGITLVMVVIALVSYFGSSQMNPVTGEKQYVKIDPDQEIALGLQAVPQLAQQHGGASRDAEGQATVTRVGTAIVERSDASKGGYPYKFHLLADPNTVNAFALPGGQVFITKALYDKLETEGQLAGVLGHEVGHVVGRHGAEHLAKQQLTQGLAGAAVIAATDPESPGSGAQAAAVAMAVGSLVNMKYGRDDELESDRLGVRFMAQAGYNPESMIGVMKILAEAGGGGRQPEFFSTHPNPENRIEMIQRAIQAEFPDGLPDGLID